nr:MULTISPECIES: LdpA C-terminal domain-containing domain [unclassified Leptolyngbya]
MICGASFQSLPDVRNLALAYALVGADCVDVAADPAVVAAAREGLQVARAWKQKLGVEPWVQGSPWLMVSLNDGEDPHFRKAAFDPAFCPSDCNRPCETICPAHAIVFEGQADGFQGVLNERCYGCGRCLPICPVQHIGAHSYVSSPDTIAAQVLPLVDAVEIHTQVGRLEDFERLWRAIEPFSQGLRAIAVSCPDGGGLVDYLWAIHTLISPSGCPIIWQTDGRPMSGDIGKGVTHAAIKLGQKVLAIGLPGYVQLAGGTNLYTVPKLKELGLLRARRVPEAQHQTHTDQFYQPRDTISGVAYGSAARVLLTPVLEQLEERAKAVPQSASISLASNSVASEGSQHSSLSSKNHESLIEAAVVGSTTVKVSNPEFPSQQLEAFPELLQQAIQLASSLVRPLKEVSPLPSTSHQSHDCYNPAAHVIRTGPD